MNSIKVLFVTTSHGELGNTGQETGIWLEELAAPYYVFKEAGAEVTIASPKGGPVPVDPKSKSIIVATPRTKSFLKDPEAMHFITHSVRLEDVKAADFDVVFLPGGHGPMWDLARNKVLNRLLEAFNDDHKTIGSVCHGVVALLGMQNNNGEFLVKDKHLTSVTNSEEKSTGLAGVVPFLLESELISMGALYSKGPDYVSYVVADGNLITGQNAASSQEVAKKIVALVRDSQPKSLPQASLNQAAMPVDPAAR